MGRWTTVPSVHNKEDVHLRITRPTPIHDAVTGVDGKDIYPEIAPNRTPETYDTNDPEDTTTGVLRSRPAVTGADEEATWHTNAK